MSGRRKGKAGARGPASPKAASEPSSSPTAVAATAATTVSNAAPSSAPTTSSAPPTTPPASPTSCLSCLTLAWDPSQFVEEVFVTGALTMFVSFVTSYSAQVLLWPVMVCRFVNGFALFIGVLLWVSRWRAQCNPVPSFIWSLGPSTR